MMAMHCSTPGTRHTEIASILDRNVTSLMSFSRLRSVRRQTCIEEHTIVYRNGNVAHHEVFFDAFTQSDQVWFGLCTLWLPDVAWKFRCFFSIQ